MAANGLAGASARALILVAYWSNHKLVPLSKIGAKPIHPALPRHGSLQNCRNADLDCRSDSPESSSAAAVP